MPFVSFTTARLATLALCATPLVFAGCRSARGAAEALPSDMTAASVARLSRQVRVTAVEPPFDDVCQVQMQRRNWRTLWLSRTHPNGSAVLIEGRYLITAAHNVANMPAWSRVTGVQVNCGKLEVPDDSCDVELLGDAFRAAFSAPSYRGGLSNDFPRDYAFVDLGKTLPSARRLTLDSLVVPRDSEAVFLGGYPGKDPMISDAGTRDQHVAGRTLFSGQGTVTFVKDNIIYYTIPTETGNSGGPVWVMRNNTPVLVGVHVVGGPLGNGAALLDPAFHRAWNTWRQERRRIQP